MAILRLQQSVNRASRTRFLGCFSLYLSMGNMAAQTNQTKPNKQNHGYDPNPRNGRREGGMETHAPMNGETRMTMNVGQTAAGGP